MSTAKASVLLFGATGFLGGSLLQRLVAHRRASSYEITALVRDAGKAKLLESLYPQVKTVSGNLGDAEVISLVAKAHIVIELANADDEAFIKTIISGLRKRHEDTGDVPIFIHSSGIGLFVDNAKGEYANETIYDDANLEQIQSLPPTALHRPVDLLIEAADQQGYARTHIIAPGTVYGRAKGPLHDAGISKPHSIQIPWLIQPALARKRAGVLGQGKAIWGAVSVDDVADLFVTVFDAATERPDTTPHGREGFFIAENGEFTWLSLSQAIGRALVELGVADSAEPTPFTKEELVQFYGSEEFGNFFGSNARARGTRSRALGWKPKHTNKDLFASIKAEVEAVMKEAAKA